MNITKEQVKIEEVMNVFYARDFAYDILRRFFIEEPSRDYLKFMVNGKLIEQFPFVDDSQGIKNGVELIKNYFNEYNPAINLCDYENLHWDYTKMFIGPFEVTAPPWESFYVRKDKLLFQETTLKVRKIYEKYNFKTKEIMEAEDHIGLELDFIYHLNQLCIQYGEASNPIAIQDLYLVINEQHRFLKLHLSKFVQKFTSSVENNAETKFYIGLAEILKSFIELDSNVLQELLNIDIIS